MKKISFLGALLINISLYAQQAIIVSSGQFGNPASNVTVSLYDYQNSSYSVIDTIHTQSAQDVLVDGAEAYVVAQDSIVKYNIRSAARIAAARFNGPSTKTLALAGNRLLVGNWYGKSSHNLYIYDANTLGLIDSVAALTKGVKSILIDSSFAYVTQNAQTSNFEDTLGSIIRLDLSNYAILDTIIPIAYTGDIGELVMNPLGTGFYAFNSVSNTISTVFFNNPNALNIGLSFDLNVSNSSQWALSATGDSIFLRTKVAGNDRIASLNMSTLQLIDSNIIDTVVTAFTYDQKSLVFYVTQTDYFSYHLGKVFDRSGPFVRSFPVGVSPEVIGMVYGLVLNLSEDNLAEIRFNPFPNPTTDQISFEIAEDAQLRLFDLNGRLVLERNLISGKQKIDLSSLSKGNYILNLRNDHSQGSKILIKE